MIYRIRISNKAQRALKKLKHSGIFNPPVFNSVLLCLEQGNSLPGKYKDHQLHGELVHFRECHLGFNLLLQYEKDDESQLIIISNIGTHQELFGE